MSQRKTCPRCKRRQSPSRFGERRGRKYQVGWCDPCISRANADHNMRSRYGITIDDYERMSEEQGHRCACCNDELGARPGLGERFHIDHCHTSGAVRGLLCHQCNVAVGLIEDNPVRALRLAEYLIGAGK